MANTNEGYSGFDSDNSPFPFESYVAQSNSSMNDSQTQARADYLAQAQAHAQEQARRVAQRLQMEQEQERLQQEASGLQEGMETPAEPDEQKDSVQVPVHDYEQKNQSPSSLPPNPTVRPVTLGVGMGAPAGVGPITQDDVDAASAYKTLEARRARKRRHRIIIGSILGALALGALGLFAFSKVGPAPVDTTEIANIGFATIEDYETSVSASGAITPASQVVVNPEIEGTITAINVAEGDKVLKGDVLFTIKNDSLDKTVQDAEMALRTANNNVESAQKQVDSSYASYSNAVDNYNKVFSTGYETQEIADAAGQQAQETLDAAEKTYDDAQNALEEARNAVTKAQEALDSANADLDKRTVRAPVGGDIIAVNARVGSSVSAAAGKEVSTSDSVVTIADLKTLRVSVQVNEVDINNLAEGQEAEVSFSALPDVVSKARVEHIASVSSGSGQESFGGVVTYNVDLVIEKPNEQIKPGMTARVKIVTNQIPRAITVPTASLVMLSDGQALINVALDYAGEDNPVFEERTVKVIAQDATTSVIEGKIADGDAVQILDTEMYADGIGTEEEQG